MDFRNILFPVDFSARCRAAVPYVKAMARLFDSSVFLLNVSESPESLAFDTGPAPRSSRTLAEMARTDFEGLTVIPVVRHGDPAAEIARFAQTRDIGLIMMPTHGTGKLRAALLGSVTAKVLNDSTCHVWTLTHPERNSPRAPGQICSLLCAIDLGRESRNLIRAAESLGTRTGAKVRLVHAVPGEEAQPQHALNVEFEHYLKDAARISAARLQQETGTSFDVCLQAGRPSRVIEMAALHHEADLVIIGRGQPHGFAGQLRADAYSIIRDCPCPVLSF